MILRPIPVLSALLVVGCSAPSEETTPASSDALWGDSLVLVEEMRLGGLMGDETETFGYVGSVAPAPDGTFYVSDTQVPIIRRYARDGSWMHDVGRGGQGPGEYRSLYADLLVDDEGRLIVWDPGNSRMSRFAPDGEFLESVTLPTAMSSCRCPVLSSDGSVLGLIGPEEGFFESAEGLRADWARIGWDGTVERLHSIPPAEAVGPRYVLAGRGGYYKPMVTETLNAMGPDGSYYTVRNDRYEIEVVRPDGTTDTIARNEEPIPLTDDEVREWTARSESFAERTPEQRDLYFPIPETKPFIRELTTDLDGRLWVSRYTEVAYMPYTEEQAADREAQGLPSYNYRDTLTWDVFDTDGRYLGRVTFPFRTSFVTASAQTVWGVSAGEFREDYVVRWTLTPAAEAPDPPGG